MANARKSSRQVAARIAALPAAYGVTSLVVACLARLLPMARIEATYAATLSSFAIFAFLVIIAFSVHSIGRLWIGLLFVSGVLTAILLISLHYGARG